MEEVISLCFRYTEEDYVCAMRAHYYQQLKRPLDVGVMVVAFAAGINLWAIPRVHWLGIACVSVVVVYWVMLAYAYYIQPGKLFRQVPMLHDEYNMVCSSAGVHINTATVDAQLPWSIYTRALVSKYAYNLYYGPRSITIIPKRIFTSVQQRENFESLLTGKISKVIRRIT